MGWRTDTILVRVRSSIGPDEAASGKKVAAYNGSGTAPRKVQSTVFRLYFFFWMKQFPGTKEQHRNCLIDWPRWLCSSVNSSQPAATFSRCWVADGGEIQFSMNDAKDAKEVERSGRNLCKRLRRGWCRDLHLSETFEGFWEGWRLNCTWGLWCRRVLKLSWPWGLT